MGVGILERNSLHGFDCIIHQYSVYRLNNCVTELCEDALGPVCKEPKFQSAFKLHFSLQKTIY